MKLANKDEGLLALAVKRGLVSAAQAKILESDRRGRSMAVILAEEAHLAPALIRALRDEQQRDLVPSRIGGYRLVGLLGTGGMSVVLKGIDESTGREVAVKLLSPRIVGASQSAPRFARETRATNAVDHPNVISSLGSGEVNGRPYQVLEYMAGGDVHSLLSRSHGRLPVARALGIIRDCAQGLAAIHAAGLVHRDVKPGNIFLDANGTAKIADLGLAREVEPDEMLTMVGQRVGTPAYMSPEHATDSAELDGRTDVYALGVTLYVMVTGRPPFSGTSLSEIISQVLHHTPEDPCRLRPDLDPRVAALIAKTMARDRAARMPSAQALADACTALLTSDPKPQTAVIRPRPRWWRRLATRWIRPLRTLVTPRRRHAHLSD